MGRNEPELRDGSHQAGTPGAKGKASHFLRHTENLLLEVGLACILPPDGEVPVTEAPTAAARRMPRRNRPSAPLAATPCRAKGAGRPASHGASAASRGDRKRAAVSLAKCYPFKHRSEENRGLAEENNTRQKGKKTHIQVNKRFPPLGPGLAGAAIRLGRKAGDGGARSGLLGDTDAFGWTFSSCLPQVCCRPRCHRSDGPPASDADVEGQPRARAPAGR